MASLQSLGGIAAAASTATPSAVTAASSASGSSFGDLLAKAVDSLQNTQVTSQSQALAVASGTGNVTDATVAASQASLETQLAVTLRNAVTGAVNQIMATPF